MWHKVETAGNHFVELVAPFFMLLPRKLRITGGVIQVMFQVGHLVDYNIESFIVSQTCKVTFRDRHFEL